MHLQLLAEGVFLWRCQMEGILYLEDGTIFRGKGFGWRGTSKGELVFNTSMTGYEEILTDPSYAGQIITMTYPLIGNYGINSKEVESGNIYAKGLVVKRQCVSPSNYMSEDDISFMLEKMKTVGICGIDTREITRKIRLKGVMKCVISTEDLELKDLKEKMGQSDNVSLLKIVTTKKIIHIEGRGPKVALLDFGAKKNIVRNLKKRGCDITIFPYTSSYEDIKGINPDGVLLSNGPGDPKDAGDSIETVKRLAENYPLFGICLGHQVLALAMGGETYKMKYGHRGANHGVYDVEMDKAYITSQNHGYAVDGESVKENGMIVTHINLNDNTVEGMRHKSLPVFSVQFHPEGSPGPQDSAYLFDRFMGYMKNNCNMRRN